MAGRIYFPVGEFKKKKTIKMLSTDAKAQKIEPDPKIFMTDESFGGSV